MFTKLPIKDQHEIIRNSNLSRKDKVFSHNYITQKIQKPQVEKEVKEFWLNLKQKCIIAWFSFIFLLIVAGGLLNQTNADNNICNSDKCEARLSNIKICEKKYKEVKDIVLCATQKAVRFRKNEMTVNDFRTTREEIGGLYNLYKGKNGIKTKLYEFVMKGEGSFQEKAFCDSYYKTKTGLVRHKPQHCTRWSIGFGTISYQGEKITYEEAIKRKQEDLNHRLSLIKSDCLTDNQKIAVVDFIYQHGQNASGIVKKANNCKIKDIYGTIVNWRDIYKKKKQSGMVKREQMRLNIFYK